MPKKKSKQEAREEQDFDSDDDIAGSVGSGAFGSIGDDDFDDGNAVEEFSDYVEKTAAKKEAERLMAWKQVRKTLGRHPHAAGELSAHADGVMNGLQRAVRNGTSDEVVLALQTAAMAVLLFAKEDGGEQLATDLATVSISVFRNSHSTTAEISLAARCMIYAYIANQYIDLQDEDLSGILAEGWLPHVQKTSPPEHVPAALSAWTLYQSLVMSNRAEYDAFVKQGVKLVNMVCHADYDVGCAALEAVGLLYEASFETDGAPPHGLGRKEITGILSDMMSDSDKTLTKQARKDRKELMRRVQCTVDEEGGPCEKIVVRSKKLEFDGWGKVLQLEAVRTLVLGALSGYLAYADVVREMLDIEDVQLVVASSSRNMKEARKAQAKESADNKKERTMKDHKKSKEKMARMLNHEE
eukprot:TRINITY_DN4765_c0_g1_i1.p1 TRINITY_DN4765_c0_g1~~TRINITY_DN4765_c0_g1_i1.p1  ORF type:complete len:412 (+),score=154.44 TRINITY_DN4765_c0_g1_i1:80-1315(+)